MNKKPKKILITGGLGFIGSNLINKINNDEFKIIVLDKCKNIKKIFNKNIVYLNDDIEKIEKYSNIIKDVSNVIHLASSSFPGKINANPILDINNEVEKNLNFYNFLSSKGIKNIIFPSSGGTVYGEMKAKLNSVDCIPNPISYYGAHKLLQENYLRIFEKEKKLSPIILRISNPYGLNQSNYKKQGIIGTAIKSIIKNNEVEIWGNGSIVRDYIHIDDVSNLIVNCLKKRKPGTFNVGSGKGYTINQILKIIKKIHGPFKIKYIEGKTYDVQKSILDISKTVNHFNWQPKISIHEGIKKIYLNVKSKER
tara:strand:+ start:504 stop:1433 length:930 start_codon:yes stop_codon:yes gene_type:complete